MALSTDEKIALAVGAGLFFALLATLSEPPEPARPASGPPSPPKPPKPNPPTPKPVLSEATDDETALARMLASETDKTTVWPVLGWLLIQTARSRNESLYERLTAGQGYGPRQKNGIDRYASTAKQANGAARSAAKRILAGELLPSAAIRAKGHSSWVELQYGTEAEAEDLLRKQAKPKAWGGVWARLRGSSWYLLSPRVQLISWAPGAARAALAKVPIINPTDATNS